LWAVSKFHIATVRAGYVAGNAKPKTSAAQLTPETPVDSRPAHGSEPT